MAEAVMEMKNKVMRDSRNGYHQKQPKYMENVQYFLDRLYTSRISTRMLINQHTTLFTELDKAVSINFFAKRILCVEQKSKQSKVRGPIQIFKMKYFFKCRLRKTIPLYTILNPSCYQCEGSTVANQSGGNDDLAAYHLQVWLRPQAVICVPSKNRKNKNFCSLKVASGFILWVCHNPDWLKSKWKKQKRRFRLTIL